MEIIANIPIDILLSKWVTVDGIQFKQDATIVHSVIDDLPQVAQIDTKYVINGSTHF